MRRTGVCFLTAVLAMALTACSTVPKQTASSTLESVPSQPSVPGGSPNIPFAVSYSEEDSLNPYLAKTQANRELAGLLYLGLTRLSADYTPEPDLAASIDESVPLSPVVTLREGAVVSDGTAVTAKDVADSFQVAKASAAYEPLLRNVQGVETVDAGTLRFTLTQRDPHFKACLSFPVLRDTGGAVPLGSGPYVYQAEQRSLAANPHASRKPAISQIQLRHLPDRDAMLHGLETGSITYFFNDFSSGDFSRTSGATQSIPLPQLLFLGVNGQRETLTAPVRQALSAAAGRDELVSRALAGNGTAALSPFPSVWKEASGIKEWESGEKFAVAVAQLQQAGYNTKSDSAGKTLSVDLLVNKDNSCHLQAARLIKSQWEAVGIAVTVTEVSYDALLTRVKDGQFDLYLGEIRLSADMSLRFLLVPGGSAAYGLSGDSPAAASYAAYLSGEQTLSAFCKAFAADFPYIPLCWRSGAASFHRNVGNVSPHAYNVYYGIEGWSFS